MSAATIHVLRVPTREIGREDLPERWCFVCRKRRRFVRTIHAPIDPMSYYGPHDAINCERGHHDGDLFPGYFRDSDEGGGCT